MVSTTFFPVCFCKSKREHLWNKVKCFFFHFKSTFHLWDNQMLTFQIFKSHDFIKCLKHETWNTFYWITCEVKVNKSGNKIWPIYIILQEKNLYQKNKCGPETSSTTFFIFQRILFEKESEEICMMILTNFDNFAIAYLI